MCVEVIGEGAELWKNLNLDSYLELEVGGG